MSYEGVQARSWVLSTIHLVEGSVEVLHLDLQTNQISWPALTHRRALFARPRSYCKKRPFACGWWVRISKVSKARTIVSESVRQTKKNTRCMGVFRQSLYRRQFSGFRVFWSVCSKKVLNKRSHQSRLSRFLLPIPWTYSHISPIIRNNWYN